MSTESSSTQSRSKVMTSRIAYATGAFGHDIFYATLSTYLIMFLTSHLFNSSDTAHNNRMILYVTTIIAVLRIVELFIDPFIGNMVDNTTTKWVSSSRGSSAVVSSAPLP